MKKITLPNLSLIAFCVAGLIVLGDALPGLTQSNLEMPAPGLEKYNEPTGSDPNGNPTYNGCGGVSNCFPGGSPTPGPSPDSTPTPTPSPTGPLSSLGVPGPWNFKSLGVNVPSTYVPETIPLQGYSKDSGSSEVCNVFGSKGVLRRGGVVVAETGCWGDQSTASYGQSAGWIWVFGGGGGGDSGGGGGDGVGAVGGGDGTAGSGSGSAGTGGSSGGGGGDGTAGSGSPSQGAAGGGGGDKSTPKNGEDGKGYRSAKPNFIAYGMKILSKKFPFDVFGTSAAGAADLCPKLEILDKKFELCIILDALKMLKIPTIIAFILWSIQSL